MIEIPENTYTKMGKKENDMNGLKKITHRINKLEEVFLVATLAVCVVVIFVQVIARYVFNNSISWSEEGCKYLFVWMIWMGTDFAARDHLCIEIISGRVKGKAMLVLDIVVKLMWLGICLFFTFNGLEVVQSMMQRGEVASSIPWLKVWVVYLVMPVSQGMLSIRVIAQIAEDIMKIMGRGQLADGSV